MKRVLISGFGPFLGNTTNPSQLVCEGVPALKIDGLELHSVVLPVTFEEAPQILINHIQQIRPDLVISLGLASERTQIEIEKVAINFRNATGADNSGRVATDEKIDTNYSEAYFTTLPYLKWLEIMKENGVSSKLSLSAGSYVCNEVFFRLMIEAQQSSFKAGFIHLPPASEKTFLTLLPKLLKEMDQE